MTASNAARNWSRAALLSLAVVCAALATGVAAPAPAGAQTVAANPALAWLEIDVWPEFDRPSAALVILRAEIAPDVALPAPVSLRVPAASGGPTAVATAASAEARLLTLPYERTNVQVDFMTISFQATNRFFHIEFYDPLATDTPERQYSYMWSGDLAAAETTVQLQEPALSTSVSVSPDLGAPLERADALLYREADLGPLELGKSLVVDVQYTKADARTSAEILGLDQQTPTSSSTGDSAGISSELLILIGAGAVVILVVAAAIVMQRRAVAAAAASSPASRVQRRRAEAESQPPECRKCGAALAPGDRFCASCGSPVKSGH